MKTSDTSKDLKLKQTSLLEDFHVNHSQSLVSEEEQMMTATCGIKLLELLPKQNVGGLLERMCQALLTSKKVRSCNKFKKIWKPKISKSNVLLFQLQASELSTNVSVSGSSDVMYPTPTSVQRPNEGNMRLMRKQVLQGNMTREEASAMVGKDVFKAHGKVNMYPTPTPTCEEKAGGKLNPNFVEFLMAYPTNWTKIEPTELKALETQSFQKLQEKSDNQFSLQKMYRTPTAMDTQGEVLHFAAKWIKGKLKRASNSKVQKTLSMDVSIEFLQSNPHLIDVFDKPFKVRTKLPEKLKFIEYLKSQTNIKELANQTDIPKTKIEHWFRKDKSFSYPSIEDWKLIKPFLKEIKFDKELTFTEDKDWHG